MSADLNALLANIQKADKELAEANEMQRDVQAMVGAAVLTLAAAQEAFDRAVAEARGAPYSAPTTPPAPQYTGPLPPPVPVGPRPITGGQLGPDYDADDRPEGIGE